MASALRTSHFVAAAICPLYRPTLWLAKYYITLKWSFSTTTELFDLILSVLETSQRDDSIDAW